MHKPDPTKHYVVGFSGGKDSTATWLYLTRTLNLPHVTCTFADTSHESKITYDYIDMLAQEHGLPLVKIQPIMEDFRGELKREKLCDRLGVPDNDDVWKLPLTMENMCMLKRRFPSTMVRFCTTHLKMFPQRRWLKENCELDETIRVSGVRSEESPARAKHSTFSFDDLMGCPLWLPIHAWTHEEVFAIHKQYGIPPNPLYLQGMSRVGCWPCIMNRKDELATMAKRFPEAYDELHAMEKRVAAGSGKEVMSFFSNYKTPPRFHSHTCPNTGKTFPDANDVKLWALGEEPASSTQGMLFEEDETEDAYACTSKYGLCE